MRWYRRADVSQLVEGPIGGKESTVLNEKTNEWLASQDKQGKPVGDEKFKQQLKGLKPLEQPQANQLSRQLLTPEMWNKLPPEARAKMYPFFQEMVSNPSALRMIDRNIKSRSTMQGPLPPLKNQAPAKPVAEDPNKKKPLEERFTKDKGLKPRASRTWGRAAQAQERFGPGESAQLFGTPAVQVHGGEPAAILDVPEVEGHINLTVGVRNVFEVMKAIFPQDFFLPITDIRVESLPGKFGEARSQEPHSIYIDLENIVQAVKQAVQAEAGKALAEGGKPVASGEVIRRVNRKLAETIWETIAHERRHDVDFQDKIKQMGQTGKGSVSEVLESAGEMAGQDALQRFRWQ